VLATRRTGPPSSPQAPRRPASCPPLSRAR
jgi:hypothetical protein